MREEHIVVRTSAPTNRPNDAVMACSFCGKAGSEVGKLFASPSTGTPAYICSECVGVCNQIAEQEKISNSTTPAR